MTQFVPEPARQIPVIHQVDLCVIGGSCTGLFAAVRAARMGLTVALVENQGKFGGTATSGMVCVWHPIHNTTGEKQIIGGLSVELIDRLRQRNALIEREKTNMSWPFCFNTAELACELDNLVIEQNIKPYLHTRMVDTVTQTTDAGMQIDAIIVENKSGRQAIAAKMFIDATGDADLIHRAAGPESCHSRKALQPPTTAVLLDGTPIMDTGDFHALARFIFDPDNPHALNNGFAWDAPVPGGPNLRMLFGSRVHQVNCAVGDELTHAEIEGRRQVRQIVDALQHHFGQQKVNMVALPAHIGVRETRQAICRHQLTETELLHGVDFHDTIACGTYRVDIHHQGGEGLTFRYLDGREEIVSATAAKQTGRWRPEQEVDPTFYQIPYRCLLPERMTNAWVAGRCIDTDMGAYGAIRVMINCNQMGEAAGAAAALAVQHQCLAHQVNIRQLQQTIDAPGIH